MELLKTLKNNLPSLWWTTPFIAFFLGYFIPHTFFKISSLETPALVGKQIEEAVILLSTQQLSLKVIAQKEDATLPSGTVITQIPAAHQFTKPHQSVFITISKRPKTFPTPHCINNSLKFCKELLKDKKIRYKTFPINSIHPHENCIAQHPEPGKALEKSVLLYISNNSSQTVLTPDFTNMNVNDVKEFLENYSITPKLYHSRSVSDDHICDSCTIIDQKPLPGSFINLNEPISIQLKIS